MTYMAALGSPSSASRPEGLAVRPWRREIAHGTRGRYLCLQFGFLRKVNTFSFKYCTGGPEKGDEEQNETSLGLIDRAGKLKGMATMSTDGEQEASGKLL